MSPNLLLSGYMIINLMSWRNSLMIKFSFRLKRRLFMHPSILLLIKKHIFHLIKEIIQYKLNGNSSVIILKLAKKFMSKDSNKG